MSRSSCRTACWAELVADALRNFGETCPEAVSATGSSPSMAQLDPAHRRPQLSGVGLGLRSLPRSLTSRRTQPHCPRLRQGLLSNTVCVVTVLAALP